MSLEIKSDNGDNIELLCNYFGIYQYSVDLYNFTSQQLAQLTHELGMFAWISIDDELPKREGWYQCKNDKGDVFGCYFDGTLGCFRRNHIQQWQPMAKGSDE